MVAVETFGVEDENGFTLDGEKVQVAPGGHEYVTIGTCFAVPLTR